MQRQSAAAKLLLPPNRHRHPGNHPLRARPAAAMQITQNSHVLFATRRNARGNSQRKLEKEIPKWMKRQKTIAILQYCNIAILEYSSTQVYHGIAILQYHGNSSTREYSSTYVLEYRRITLILTPHPIDI